jgi:putative ABC transport system permease protein
VRRLAWSQLRFRTGRALALLAGILVAATAFTVLTAAARTTQARTVGTVNANFQPAYDILVRPAGARSSTESATGTVQPDFLSGIYGGITMAQWHAIQQIAGVQVAAPIAMVGYMFMEAASPVEIPVADVKQPGRQLYRVSTTWVSANGATRVEQPPSYVYVTPNRVTFSSHTGTTTESLPGGSAVTPCPSGQRASSPFEYLTRNWCWSKSDGLGLPPNFYYDPPLSAPGYYVDWQFPMLIAAVDPTAETELDGLNHAITAGRYLPTSGLGTAPDANFAGGSEFPVLASSDSGIGEYTVTQLQELAAPTAPPVLDAATMRADATAPGRTVLTTTSNAQQAYQSVLGQLGNAGPGNLDAIGSYWSVGQVRYQQDNRGVLAPAAVSNPVSVWQLADPPLDNADTQYRALTERTQSSGTGTAIAVPVGTFNQAKVQVFDPLSKVPLGPYLPTAATPANQASKTALGGGDLLPNLNLGGFLSQPVQLVTTLSALPVLESSRYGTGGTQLARAPISVIRVRVSGVTGPNQASLHRIAAIAQQIEDRTHLTVDIVAGSSPAPTTIALPADKDGTPALLLTEDWVKEDVAVTILNAVDRSSLVLFILILVVCALFVANSATAAVRGRRPELGVLACLGWTKPRLFGAVLGEVALIGLVAGVLGALLSPPLAAALGLHASLARAVLAIPVAVALALVAGAVPATLAARAEPVAATRPPVLAVRRARQPSGITGLAVVNLLRTPGRTLIGAFSLAVGVAALTLLIAVTLAFSGTVDGTLLGDFVTLQVRGVDYVAVAATVALGVFAVGDALLISITERAPELATLRAFGWPEAALRRLVITEGALTGIIGSVTGAALGLAGAAVFAGKFTPLLLAATAAAMAAGVLVTCLAALLPAHLLRRLPAAQLLAQE